MQDILSIFRNSDGLSSDGKSKQEKFLEYLQSLEQEYRQQEDYGQVESFADGGQYGYPYPNPNVFGSPFGAAMYLQDSPPSLIGNPLTLGHPLDYADARKIGIPDISPIIENEIKSINGNYLNTQNIPVVGYDTTLQGQDFNSDTPVDYISFKREQEKNRINAANSRLEGLKVDLTPKLDKIKEENLKSPLSIAEQEEKKAKEFENKIRLINTIGNAFDNTIYNVEDAQYRFGQALAYKPLDEDFTDSDGNLHKGAQKFAKGFNIARGIAAGGKAILGGARNVFAGYATQHRNDMLRDAYYKRQVLANKNRNTTIARQAEGGLIDENTAFFNYLNSLYADGGQISEEELGAPTPQQRRPDMPIEREMTGEYIQQPPRGANIQPNAEVEAGEYIQHPDGQVQEVEGRKHSQGGERLDLDMYSKVVSDKTKIGLRNAKIIKETYGIEAKAKDTYANVINKFTKKIGLEELNDEQQKYFEKLKSNDKTKDNNTADLNTEFLGSKINEIESKKSVLEQVRAKFTSFIYDLQEQSKKQKELAKKGEAPDEEALAQLAQMLGGNQQEEGPQPPQGEQIPPELMEAMAAQQQQSQEQLPQESEQMMANGGMIKFADGGGLVNWLKEYGLSDDEIREGLKLLRDRISLGGDKDEQSIYSFFRDNYLFDKVKSRLKVSDEEALKYLPKEYKDYYGVEGGIGRKYFYGTQDELDKIQKDLDALRGGKDAFNKRFVSILGDDKSKSDEKSSSSDSKKDSTDWSKNTSKTLDDKATEIAAEAYKSKNTYLNFDNKYYTKVSNSQSLSSADKNIKSSGKVSEENYPEIAKYLFDNFRGARDYFSYEGDEYNPKNIKVKDVLGLQKYFNNTLLPALKSWGEDNLQKGSDEYKHYMDAIDQFVFDDTGMRKLDGILGNYTISKNPIGWNFVLPDELKKLNEMGVRHLSQVFDKDGSIRKDLSWLSDDSKDRLLGASGYKGLDLLISDLRPEDIKKPEEEVNNPDPKDNVNELKKSPPREYVRQLYPDMSLDYPQAQDNNMKQVHRYETIDPVKISPENMLRELYRYNDSTQSQIDGLTDSQRNAMITNLGANSQDKAFDVMSKIAQQNALQRYQVDSYNNQIRNREEDMNVNDALQYEQMYLKGKAMTDQDIQDYHEKNREINIMRFNREAKLRAMNNMFENLKTDEYGNLVFDRDSWQKFQTGIFKDMTSADYKKLAEQKAKEEKEAEKKKSVNLKTKK